MLIHSIEKSYFKSTMPLKMKILKSFLKIDNSNEDELLKKLVNAALDKLEAYIGKAIIKQELLVTYCYSSNYSEYLELPISEALSINFVKLFDSCKSARDLHENLFFLQGNRLYLSIKPCYSMIKVSYTAALSKNSNTIPDSIQQALMEIVAYMYEGSFELGVMNNYDNFRNLKI